uniref:Major facilitator superfamily (MFS) profile domain-containing protein n=1 Tax=Ananas comosus var. bracteatus TaxID=296719 RepID=A0A6V7QB62_ANACO|nr:unnamed protein product [Ananas comosus var. bracteatus]
MMEDVQSTFTVDEALMSLGFGKFQAFVLVYAGMGWVAEAMEMMLLSSLFWGIVSDSYGRRQLMTSYIFLRTGFLFTALVTSVAGLVSAFAPNYTSLIIMRFFVGIGLGGGPVLSSWFLEFIPAPNRGTWMVIFSAFWTIGTIFEASLAWAIMPKFGWRWLLGLSALPSFLLLLFYSFTPESPRYLCMNGKVTDATGILEKMARANRGKLPSGRLVSDHKIELDEISDSSEATYLVSVEKQNDIDEDTNSKNGGIRAVLKLLTPSLIRSTLLLWMVFFGNAFSYYGIVLLTSELSNGNRACASKEMQSSHTDDVSLYKNVFVSSFAEIPGLVLSAVMVDRIGRKLSMSSMLFISCVFLLPLVFHQTEAITTASLFGARICISASFTIVYIYAPEIYPTSVRTTGIGIASSVGRIGGILCPLVAVGLVHGCHQTSAVLLFELVIFLSGIAVSLFPFETSGCKLNDTIIDLK